jgi:predicted dehydrogenase
MHAEHAAQLIKNNVHLFIEKPIAHESDKMEQVVAEAGQKNLVIAVGYNLRFLQSVNALKTILKAKEFGQLYTVALEVGQYLPDWRPGSDYTHTVSAQSKLGGGALLELSHELDYLRYIIGQPQQVNAMGGTLSNLNIDVEDAVKIIARLQPVFQEQAVLASVSLDFLQRHPTRTCKLVFENGEILWDIIGQTLSAKGIEETSWRTLIDGDAVQVTYQDELSDVIDAVENGSQPKVTGVDALETLKFCEAVRKAMERGQSTEVCL